MSSAAEEAARVVFIHGSGDSAAVWQRQVAFLGEERALALDLPGHGMRAADAGPEEMSVYDYALDVRAQIHAAGLRRPIVAGHSLGGAIALQLALDWPEEFSGLILIGTGARLRVLPALLESARRDQIGTLQQIRGLARRTDEPARPPEALPLGSVSTAAVPPLADGVFYRDLAACNAFDVMAELGRITLPALVVCGEEDAMTPPKYAEYLRAHLSHATLHMIPGAGHAVMRDQPEALNAAIGQWLASAASA
jgi:pimeloyl-ACP methyl ester carboxylesterase